MKHRIFAFALALVAIVAGAASPTIPATSGGTGLNSYTVGDTFYACTTTTLCPLAAPASGNALLSGGVGTAPTWGKVGLDTMVSGILPPASGGTGSTSDLSTEILADSPTVYYKLDETSGTTLTDASGHGFNLTTAGTVTLAYTYVATYQTAKKMFITGASGGKLSSAMGLTLPITGDWTLECIMVIRNLNNPERCLTFGGNGSGGAGQNSQFALIIQTTGQFSITWEQGANVGVTNLSGLVMALNTPYHLIAVKDSVAKTITFYVNGRKLVFVNYTLEPTGGGTAPVIGIGTDAANRTSGDYIVGDVAYYNGVKLSEARIRAHALASGLM